MTMIAASCPKFLGVLGDFYRGLPDFPPLEAALVAPGDVPEPYRSLLVHQRDMTSTLEAHHGESLSLRVLQRRIAGDTLSRHIVLEGAHSGRPAEYGAIRIRLSGLTEEARREAVACRTPLGRILTSQGITFGCCPGGFFRIRSNRLIDEALRLDGPRWLYGRCNCLSNGDGRAIAEVVEILPPSGQTTDASD
jgi:hypothetical protein